MDTIRCALTGVDMNPIPLERVTFTYSEAVTVWILKLKGTKYALIAQHMGANALRIGEVLRGEVHPGARQQALALLAMEDVLDDQDTSPNLRVPGYRRKKNDNDQPRLI